MLHFAVTTTNHSRCTFTIFSCIIYKYVFVFFKWFFNNVEYDTVLWCVKIVWYQFYSIKPLMPDDYWYPTVSLRLVVANVTDSKMERWKWHRQSGNCLKKKHHRLETATGKATSYKQWQSEYTEHLKYCRTRANESIIIISNRLTTFSLIYH